MIELFADEADGGFFLTAADAEKLIVRTKDVRDGAVPSGNSVALLNLLRLSLVFDRADYRQKAERTMEVLGGTMAESWYGFERFLWAIDFNDSRPQEIVIVGSPSQAETAALIQVVHQRYDPYCVLVLLDPSASDKAAWQQEVPLLRGKLLVEGKPTAYVCRNNVCRRPVMTASDLRRELEAN